jgi:hypothetical protein
VRQEQRSVEEEVLSEKLHRKELRQPDEFQAIAGGALEWMLARKKAFLLGLGAVVVAALATWGFTALVESRELRAGNALDEAIALEVRPVVGEGYAPPGTETFPSREERTKAALAALEKVRADAPSSRAAKTALAQIGFVKLKASDFGGAAQALNDYLAQSRKGDALRAFAVEALGYALEGQGKLDEAKGAFARLGDEGVPQRAAFQQARLALLQGKPDAKQLLEQVAKDYPKDPVALEAQQRVEIAALPPPPPPGAQASAAAAAPKKDAKPQKPLAKKK